MNKSFSLLLILIFFFLSCKEEEKILRTISVEVNSPDDIIEPKDSIVDPILYKNIELLTELSVEQSKEKFIQVVLPAILISKYFIERDRNLIEELKEKDEWSQSDSSFYEVQMEKFDADNMNDLISRMNVHPTSIVIAQAAVESGWGSSRFFTEANNLFGIWSFDPEEPRIAAAGSNAYLRKYNNISQSINDYFVTIGRSFAYKKFREKRKNTDNIQELLPHLNRYSERGMAYVNQLNLIIEQNNLTKYDNYRINEEYIITR
ncbi:glucosaminidase domain-containing protein [Mangrovivirga sp. M17]|uniref:Glucosaminidase domain-containing protein n=1 Tax=Mangrovivirga halotolerans TaxID=2993936 RepID=A0ABT3RRG7_9BACT|nr:glucosaminidase domain-containing protein [Mangrovivirga halotolerans]MCX2744162.1 glucosaminidase domain-containing protein [Mangrovivirga halotolerans]